MAIRVLGFDDAPCENEFQKAALAGQTPRAARKYKNE